MDKGSFSVYYREELIGVHNTYDDGYLQIQELLADGDTECDDYMIFDDLADEIVY